MHGVLGALSLGQPSCAKCWCKKECDKVGGETLCGTMRMYYIDRLNRK